MSLARLFLGVLALLGVGGTVAAQAPPKTDPSAQVPIDHGPDTPAANNAYQGGGVVLQGAPGAPAPQVKPTPPGQKPANMIPPAQ